VTNVTCSVKICPNPARERGWCMGHYKRYQVTGDVRADIPLGTRTPRRHPPCIGGNCDEPHYARGRCSGHYDAWFDAGGYEQTAKYLANVGSNVRTCTSCGETKPVGSFDWRPGETIKRERIRHSWCKACLSAKNRVRYLANQEKRKADASKRYAGIRADPQSYLLYSLRQAATRLGLDANIVTEYFKSHNGLCEICGDRNIDPSRTRLTIDHDHITGEFRGILCSNCNRAIGLFKDDSKTAMMAAIYLERHGR
jgi:hypothetical protein